MNAFNNCKMICAALITAASMMLSSCMDDGNNKITGQTAGIVRFDPETIKNVLDISAYESFYSPLFADMEEGTCCYVAYELDYGIPENSNAQLAANGYYTVTLTKKMEVDKYYMTFSPDTSSVALPEESPLINPVLQINGYVKGTMFLLHQIKCPSDQKMQWKLSCDLNDSTVNENGLNIYDVYLRATVSVAGTKTSEDRFDLCAYNMTMFMENIAQREKNLGNNYVYLR
ncbi:MAG: hypothetical protein LBR26_10665, partial [Prevotella sp.]|nr:hypothetical protein [Prevotella sp.]